MHDLYVIHHVIPNMQTLTSPDLKPAKGVLRLYLRSHFAPAFFFLADSRKKALQRLYAVCRVLDDAVDQPASDPVPFLAAWRQTIEESNPRPVESFGFGELAKEFLMDMKNFDIPSFAILDLIDKGVSIDLNTTRFETSMDTESYCYGVAGTVGVACLPIFGVPWQEAKDFAVRLGIAVQWVNLIRDVGTDAKMGRIYLPLDHLQKFECKEEDILAARGGENFLKLMDFEASLARSHYQRAMDLLPLEWKKNLLPARIMGKIYLKLLEKLAAHRYPVFEKRINLNAFEKIGATIAAWKE